MTSKDKYGVLLLFYLVCEIHATSDSVHNILINMILFFICLCYHKKKNVYQNNV